MKIIFRERQANAQTEKEKQSMECLRSLENNAT